MLMKAAVLDNVYQIDELIGKGGMSCVYKASCLPGATENSPQLRAGDVVAIKELSLGASHAGGRALMQGVSKHLSMMQRIDHPSIARVYDAFAWDGCLYLVSEYVAGRSLLSLVKSEGAQDQRRVCAWALQLCRALAYLHGLEPAVIYRDMKPGNVIMRADGSLKLVDLGIAREYKYAAEQDKDTDAFGTQGYAPPEQYGRAQTDERSDIYALGATMWHLLAGFPPPGAFPLTDIRQVNSSIDAHVAQVVATCTNLDREQRYQDCAKLEAALEQCVVALEKQAASSYQYLSSAFGGAEEGDAPATSSLADVPRMASPSRDYAVTSHAFDQVDAESGFFFAMLQSELVVHTVDRV